MVGIYGAASSVHHMAPWGGTEPLPRHQPRSRVAIPTGKRSAGHLRHRHLGRVQRRNPDPPARRPADAGRLGAEPQGWLADHRSEAASPRAPTCRWGGYKGSGLSLVIGLLAGPLNRAAFGRDINDFRGATRERAQCRAIRGRARRGPASCRRRCSRPRSTATSATLASSQRLPGVDENPRAGAGPGSHAARSARRTGVPLGAALVAQVDEVAKSLGVTPLSGRAMSNGRGRQPRKGRRFWRFSLRFYRQPQVADACIAFGRSRPASTSTCCCSCSGHASRKARVLDRRGRGARGAASDPGAT